MNSLELVKAVEAELKKKKIKKSEFYEKTGISSATFSQWRNEIYAPSSANLRKIEEYLGIKFTIEQKENPTASGEVDFSDMELLAKFKAADETTQELIRRALGLK